MNDILKTISLTTIISILLVLSAGWLIIAIIKRKNAYVFRAMMIVLLLLLSLIFLRQYEEGRITWLDSIGKAIFGKTKEYNYNVEKGFRDNKQESRYVFQNPKPRLSLALDKSSKFFNITDLKPINDVLKHLDLPELKEKVSELISVTGSRSDTNLYMWRNYPQGILTIQRTLCQNRATLEVYHCLESISILKK